MLSTTPILAAPAPGEPMMLYVAATPRVVSAVFVVVVAMPAAYYFKVWRLKQRGR